MRQWLQKLTSLRRAQEGVAYLEFAITLPFLVAIFLGAVEITRYIILVQKVEKASQALSDLVAQSEDITTTQLNQLILAAGQIVQPFDFGPNGYAIVTSVTRTGTDPAVVNWQYASSGSSGGWTHASLIGTPGNTATLPTGFTVADRENVIFAEVYYNFSPIIVSSVLGNRTLYKTAIFKPRLGDLSSLGS
jgi:Flp pilus assembly protein TadG